MRGDLAKNIIGILREAEADRRSSGTCATDIILLSRPFPLTQRVWRHNRIRKLKDPISDIEIIQTELPGRSGDGGKGATTRN